MIAMYIEKVPNRNSPPAVLLRESYREGDQVKKRTLANLSKLPDDIIDNIKLALKGATLSMTEGIPNHFEVIRSLPHGHVMAIWLFSTLCDNFCLCKVKCLLGKTFRTILKEETISIDLVYTQKPEEPLF